MKNLIVVIFFFIFFIFFSCTKKEVVEQLSRDNELLISTYGKPSDDRFVASFSSTETSKDTLLILKIEYGSEKEIETLKKIKLKIDNLSSYIHMSINRWFASEQRLMEYMAYHFCRKYYNQLAYHTNAGK